MGTRTVSQTINLKNPDESVGKYITRIDENGITVHPEDNNSSFLEITSNGIELKQGSRTLAYYGETIRLGDLITFLQLTGISLDFILNSRTMATFGYNEMYESYGLTAENVMITGAGNAMRLDNGLHGTYQGQFILETRSNGHLSLKPGLTRTEEEEEE